MSKTIKKGFWVMSETELPAVKVVLLRHVNLSRFIVQAKYVGGVCFTTEFETLTSALDELKRLIMCEYWEYLV